MNSRREFFQNNLLSFGILPLLNRFDISNNDFLPRWDVAAKVVENFILDMAKNIDDMDLVFICYDNLVDDNKVGIYGLGLKKEHLVWSTKIDWLKKYNVSSSHVINAISAYYLKNGFSKSERIIGSNNFGSSEWGIRVYKENK